MTTTFWDQTWQETLTESIPAPDGDRWINDIDCRKMKFMRRHAPQSGTVVEVGCGSARLLARLGREISKLRLIAVDESPAALQLAEQTAIAFGVEIETALASAASLPMADDAVDMVISGGLLEHFPDPLPILREMLRVLRPGGILYADVVPRKYSWYRSSEARRIGNSEWLAPGVYESSLAATDYRRMLADLGCRQIATLDCGVYPQRIQQMWGRRRQLLARATELLDGTPIATRWGWYFMFVATKGF